MGSRPTRSSSWLCSSTEARRSALKGLPSTMFSSSVPEKMKTSWSTRPKRPRRRLRPASRTSTPSTVTRPPSTS